MACDHNNEFECGDSLYDLTKKILGRLKQLVGFGPSGGGGDVTLTVSDVEIGAVEIKDSTTDNRATVRNTDPVATDYGLVVRNIPSGTQAISAAALPLPAGAATEATLATMLTLAGFQARINTLGQKASAASTPVVLSTEQEAILQTISGYLSGSVVPLSPTAATVGVTSSEVVAENLSRSALYLTNTSNNIISLGFGVAAVLNSGITLFPGDSFAMLRPGFIVPDAVNAIASAAGSNLAIQEATL